jgi:hypothetical protein
MEAIIIAVTPFQTGAWRARERLVAVHEAAGDGRATPCRASDSLSSPVGPVAHSHDRVAPNSLSRAKFRAGFAPLRLALSLLVRVVRARREVVSE